MDNLKSIWNQLNINTHQLELTVKEGQKSILEKLKHEEALRKRYNPFLVIAIILFTIVLSSIILNFTTSLSIPKIIGIILVSLANICVVYFSQGIKLPIKNVKHNCSSVNFLSLIKVKLDNYKKKYIFGITLQFLFLTSGLFLIIFYNVPHYNIGFVFTFFGFMCGLGGIAIGGAISFFNSHYKSTYQVIDHFLSE